jgi:hypothetical protein
MTSTERPTALQLTTDLSQIGAVFNDAVRLSDGGLWDAPILTVGNNQVPYEQTYVTDLHAVQEDIGSILATGTTTANGITTTLNNVEIGVLDMVSSQVTQLIADAPGSVGNTPTAIADQLAIHTIESQILAEVNGNTGLHGILAGLAYTNTTNGLLDVGFQNLPKADANVNHATALGATLVQIGEVFNAASDLATGGLNHSNIGTFNAEMVAVNTGLNNILNSPTALAAIEAGETPTQAALTTIHLETVQQEVSLQITDFDNQVLNGSITAPRSTNDNLLDIIDIINGDPNLAAAAGATVVNGAATTSSIGFGEFPGYLTGPGGAKLGGTIEQFQDDQQQTNFWSEFIAGANDINTKLNQVADGVLTGNCNITALEQEITAYTTLSKSFDASQGGIFGARFDNELLQGTESVDSSNALTALNSIMTHGLTLANTAQAKAAGMGFVADANDVSGNNLAIGGTTYNGASLTVAGATTPGGVATTTMINQNPNDDTFTPANPPALTTLASAQQVQELINHGTVIGTNSAIFTSDHWM